MSNRSILLSLLLCLFSTSLCAKSLSEEEQWEFVEKKLVSPVARWSCVTMPVKFATSLIGVGGFWLGVEVDCYLLTREFKATAWHEQGLVVWSILLALAGYKIGESVTEELINKVFLISFLKNWETKYRRKTPIELRMLFDQENERYSGNKTKYFLTCSAKKVISLAGAALSLYKRANPDFD